MNKLGRFILLNAVLVSVLWALILLSTIAVGQDWPSRGGNRTHNPVVETDKVFPELQFAHSSGSREITNFHWRADIGMGFESEPAISDGLVWVGGSNRTPRDSRLKGDAGVLFCFRESDGNFLYQHVSPRRKEGRLVDWPSYGIASTPFVEKNRVYFCTNRCETVCLDIQPLLDGTGVPTELWKVDMVDKFGVFHGAAHIGSRHLHCSPAVWESFVYVNTTHTVRSYQDPPADKPPSLICFDKRTGKVVWTDNTPGNDVLGFQWNNPTVIRAGGRDQVITGQGDGWVRSFDCRTGDLIWKFDMNEKSARLKFGEKRGWQSLGGLRQAIAEPVFCNGRLYLVGGYEYESGQVTGRLCCIDPAKAGDLSSELLTDDKRVVANSNAGVFWEFRGSPSGPAGVEADRDNPNVMHGSFGSVAVQDGFVVCVDLNGSLHCLDEKTGTRHWSYDTDSVFFNSPLVIGNRIVVANEDGVINEIPLSTTLDRDKIRSNDTLMTLHSSPVFANDKIFFTTLREIYAVECKPSYDRGGPIE